MIKKKKIKEIDLILENIDQEGMINMMKDTSMTEEKKEEIVERNMIEKDQVAKSKRKKNNRYL